MSKNHSLTKFFQNGEVHIVAVDCIALNY